MRDAHLGAVAEEVQTKINNSLSRNSDYMADAYKRPLLRNYACIGERVIRLIDDAVLIRLEKPERWHAKAKLWIPDSAKREDWEVYHGVVIACGPGMRHAKRGHLIPMELKPGDHVQFYWMSGEADITELFGEEGQEYRIISEKSVQAVLHD